MNFISKGEVVTMNNQQGTIDQMSQLENIARVKQFMRKGSIKVMMVVGFIQAILTAVLSFKISGFLKNIMTVVEKSSDDIGSIPEAVNIVVDISTTIGLVYTAFMLIFPVTLLMIIMKANSDDPTVIARGPVTFLKIIAIIQLVLNIISGVITLVGVVSSMKNSDGNSISALVSNVVTVLISCFYFYCQVKFLSSIRTACDGVTLSSEGAQGVGVFNVLAAIGMGLILIVVIIIMVIVTSFSKSEQLANDNSYLEFIEASGMDIINFFFVVITAYIVLSMISTIAYAITAFGYRDMVVGMVRESYAAAQTKHTSNQKLMRTYGGGTMYNSYNYSNSGTGVQDNSQNHEEVSVVPPVQNTAPPQSVPSQQPQVALNKPSDNIQNTNPYTNMQNGSFTPSNPYANAGNGSFTPDPYANTENNPYANAGNGSFTPDPYANTENNPYANTGNGSFTPDPYANTENNPYANTQNEPFAGNSQFDYQPNQGNSQFDYQPNQANSQFDYQPNQGNSQFDYQPNQGNSQFDYQPNQGNSQFDYQPNQGNSQFDYQPNQSNSPFDYHDPNEGNSPFDYHPNQNPYGNGH